MAVVSYRVSDLDSKSKVTGESTFLAFNGEAVTIDLSEKEAKELREGILAVYFDKGVKVAAKAPKVSNGAVTNDLLTGNAKLATIEEVREWGNANGFEVAAKGRIAKEVYVAFNAFVNDPKNVKSVDIDS